MAALLVENTRHPVHKHLSFPLYRLPFFYGKGTHIDDFVIDRDICVETWWESSIEESEGGHVYLFPSYLDF